MEKQKEFIENFAFDSSVIFYGKPWRGKTFIMKQLYKKYPENVGSLNKYWIDDGQFRENITSGNMTLKPNDAVGQSVLNYPLEMSSRVKVLFFDDLGSSENVSEAQRTKLKYILDEREKKGLVNIFSTNLTPKEFADLYGERIKSRIFNGKQDKGLMIIHIEGEDRRKENIKKLTL